MSTKVQLDRGHPPGMLVGRLSAGTGPAEYISVADLAQSIASTGVVASGARPASLASSGVTAGSYTNTNLTVNAQGLITAASNGTGGSSALALISTMTASGSASLAWTGLASQTSWRLVGRLLVPASNNVGLGLVFGTGAGPTYITTGYKFGLAGFSSSNGSASFGAENQAVCPCDNGTTANAGGGTSFDLTITTDNASFIKVNGTCEFRGQSSHDITLTIGCNVPVAAAVTAMKLSFGTGNIASGTASLYSLAA